VKKLAVGLLVVAGLLLAAVLVGPGFVDWNHYKPEIATAVRDASGRDVALDGNISLSLLPAPSLSIADVRVGGPPGTDAADTLQLKSLDVRVALGPLLTGDISVTSVRLVEPVAVLEVLPDGRQSWDFGPASKEATSQPGTPVPPSDDGTRLSLDHFEVTDGTLIYRDRQSGGEFRVDGIGLEGAAGSLHGPFDVAGTLRYGELPIEFNAAVGRLVPGQVTGLRLMAKLLPAQGNLEFTGSLRDWATEPVVTGSLKVSATNVGTLPPVAGANVRAILARPLNVAGNVTASRRDAALNDVRLSLGDISATGAINVGYADDIGFDVALAVNRINLDTLLLNVAETAGDTPAPGASTPGQSGTAAAIPDGMTGSINLSVDGVTYQGSVIRQVQLTAGVADGAVTLTRAAALLPGGSDVNLSGRATNSDAGPRFDGRVEMASDNLRGLLIWLGSDVSRVPGGRLTQLAATADVSVTPDLLEVGNANVRVDGTTLTGGLAYRLQDRPSFGLSVNMDRLNLDGYLPAALPTAEAAATQTTAEQPAIAATGPLSLLGAFDANIVATVGQLTYNGVPVKAISTELSLVEGLLNIRQAELADVGGAALRVSGSASGFADQPTVDLTTSIEAADLGGVARLVAIDLPVTPDRLGAVSLLGKLSGDAETLSIDVSGGVDDATVSVKGSIADLMAAPLVDIAYRLDHPSLARLSDMLELTLSPDPTADSAIGLNGRLVGGTASASLQLKATLANMQLEAAGEVVGEGDERTFAGDIDLRGDDLIATLAGLGTGYRPAVQNPGGFALTTRFNGTASAMQVAALTGSVGPARFEGEGRVTFDGPRPFVVASLATNEIIVDLFLPRPPGETAGGAGTGTAGTARTMPQERWSREPIDLTYLDLADADIELQAAGLVFQDYPFAEPRLKLSLRDGLLKIDDLTGRLFDGDVALTAELNTKPLPTIAVDVQVTDADLEPMLKTALDLDQVAGLAGFQGRFDAVGQTEWDLVRSLNGTAMLAARDGTVRGFDMQRLSDRLDKLTENAHFVDLLSGTFAGGETAMQSAEGRWTIEHGVARTDDTRAVLDASEARLAGTIDLPAWQLDLRGVLDLTEHDDAPEFGVHVTGPLDAPRRDLKTRELEQWFVARVGREVLRKTLDKNDRGGAAGAILDALTGQTGRAPRPSAPAPAPASPPAESNGQTSETPAQQPAPPVKLDEALEGAIRNILKR